MLREESPGFLYISCTRNPVELGKSKQIQDTKDTEDFEIDVSGIKLLQLRVSVEGRNTNFRCYPVWLDPYIKSD